MRPRSEAKHIGPVVVRIGDDTFVDGVASLRWQLRDLLQDGAQAIIVDVRGVRQLSSTSVAVLLSAHRVCRTRGGGVVIRRPSRRMLDQLRRTGLHHVFQIDVGSGDEGRADLRNVG